MAVFSTIGAIIGGNKQAKAIDKASDAQAAATKEAVALQKDIYNKNVGFQTPWMNTGLAANAQINALLGLQPAAPAGGGIGGGLPGTQGPGTAPGGITQENIDNVSSRFGPLATAIRNGLMAQQGMQSNPVAEQVPVQQAPTVTQPTAQSAYEQFKNYTGYTTRLNEANNALNSGYAAKGTLQSGAALQALAKMNQDYASNEFGNYMGYLTNQQQLGPGAANALSGVGTQYANNVGNMTIQQGNNLANAYIAKGNNSANMIGNIAGGLGQATSFLLSEREAKRDIEEIGPWDNKGDGLKKYRFRYKHDPEGATYEGVMADEVAELRPEAIGPKLANGWRTVNYAAL